MRGTLLTAQASALTVLDHPRACGELSDSIMWTKFTNGSSPRMRGTLVLQRRRRVHHRIIPAHAGNSPSVRWSQTSSPDHPRACGELSSLKMPTKPESGSSPRMRGTPQHLPSVSQWSRIIPAHAGNSLERPLLMHVAGAYPRPDHPRACGELSPGRPVRLRPTGSSPRMRGTHGRDRPCPRVTLRIIPAHAGNALSAASITSFRLRIIPAHAGNSGLPDRQRPHAEAPSDHPRACGELVFRIRLSTGVGSSPRMRGTPGLAVAAGSSPRMRGTLFLHSR